MNAQHFNATTELNKLRQHKAICRKQHYQHSRLNKYRVELVELYKAGASLRELTLWLRRENESSYRTPPSHVS
ncbi:MAG: hypothetical protein HWD59_06865 [Coxiellaceae bacterium]|nr:MAG: hypothetical protein HWD59_06865 [Coxiellaceae bacterium]